jgi:tetratricopeptide (TPR) repeat protein
MRFGIDSMTRNAASTSRHAVGGRVSAGSSAAVDEAARLAEQAEEILGGYLHPGRWPTARIARRFLQSGDLERVLGLYTRAMESDPYEPAYPWNLASSLDRLRLANLALTFIRRAIRVAEETGDREWAGADAHLAWADIAIHAGEPETAEIAIERARRIDPHAPFERYLRRLRRESASGSEDLEIARNEDSARKGAAVEHLIAASLMLESGFELNVSTNLVDDEGVDLVFHRRQDSTMLAVQIKSRSWSANVMRGGAKFIADIRRSTFRPRRDLFLLFVAIDAHFADFGPLWLIPSLDFADILASSRGPKLRFAASASPASSDRWTPYRFERSQLPERILDELSALETAEDS